MATAERSPTGTAEKRSVPRKVTESEKAPPAAGLGSVASRPSRMGVAPALKRNSPSFHSNFASRMPRGSEMP